jgi:cell division protein FtsB
VFDVITGLLQQLESEEQALSRRRRMLHARIATFPDTTGSWAKEERELSTRRRELHRQIDALRAGPTPKPSTERTAADVSTT